MEYRNCWYLAYSNEKLTSRRRPLRLPALRAIPLALRALHLALAAAALNLAPHLKREAAVVRCCRTGQAKALLHCLFVPTPLFPLLENLDNLDNLYLLPLCLAALQLDLIPILKMLCLC